MTRWFNRRLVDWLLKDAAFSDEHTRALLALAQEGSLVFVLPYSSVLLYLGLKRKIAALGLAKDTRIISLKRPATLVTKRRGSEKDEIALLMKNGQSGPLIFVPHLLVLGRRRARAEKSAMDLVFGSRDAPGYLRLLLRLLLARGQAHWQMGEAFKVQTESPNLAQLRFGIRRQFHRLESAHIGPRAKSYRRIKAETLKDASLLSYMKKTSLSTGVSLFDIKKKGASYFHEIAANFDGEFVRVLDYVLRFLFHRLYDGLSYNSCEVNQLRKASLKGPLVFLPTHKSHMDYLVMSYVLYQEGLMPPHVAAGANLSFFPLGPLFRRGGAFFIRRQFKGDPLYPQVVRAYLNRLLKEGFTTEFFIEGGRSRTGKTLTPKLGLLSIYLDCLCSDRFQDAVFVPASIAYERIVEAHSYDEEQGGGAKREENAQALLQSTQVLSKRFGRVFVSFDKPIVLSEFMAARSFDYASANAEERQRFIKALAHQAVMGMNQSVVVTPASLIALVLLSSPTRALRQDRFLSQCLDVLGLLCAISPQIRLSDALLGDIEQALEQALQLLAQDGQIVQKSSQNLSYVLAPAKKARALNYYKNTILHFFVSDALIACAFLAEEAHNAGVPVSLFKVKQRVQALSQIFKYEFVFAALPSFDTIFEQRLLFLKERGVLAEKGGFFVLGDSVQAASDLALLSRMLRPFFETYFVVFYDAQQDATKELSSKELVHYSLKHLAEGLGSGLITRPEAVNKSACESAVLLLQSSADEGAKWPDKAKVAVLFHAISDVLDAIK